MLYCCPDQKGAIVYKWGNAREEELFLDSWKKRNDTFEISEEIGGDT